MYYLYNTCMLKSLKTKFGRYTFETNLCYFTRISCYNVSLSPYVKFAPLGHRTYLKKKEGEIHSKMALRTICAAALRTGTDLGVNNARTFVTTGIVTILFNFIVFTYRNCITGLQYSDMCVRLHH